MAIWFEDTVVLGRLILFQFLTVNGGGEWRGAKICVPEMAKNVELALPQ
jgi:hypothetical protein